MCIVSTDLQEWKCSTILHVELFTSLQLSSTVPSCHCVEFLMEVTCVYNLTFTYFAIKKSCSCSYMSGDRVVR